MLGEQLAHGRAGARRHPSLSSFDFVDEILRKLANKTMFPNMKAIVVAGHSAGGQFANRYEMSNKIHDTLGVPITYVVANPSSYAWPDAVRPLAAGRRRSGDRARKAGTSATRRRCRRTRITRSGRSTRPRRANFNRWPSGLENRTGYNASLTDAQLKKQLVERPTTYLLGQVDTLPLGGFDSSRDRDGAGPDAARARRGVLQVRDRDARREAHDHDRPGVRPQRPLHVHDEHRVPGDLPEGGS